ncbi:recombinase family protein [Streptococcus gallinaceus]|uniref:DNA invertase Pin-like site-specific DNA recombinase n=1 Tax=Streptococcus gallinaceus TaxID=165758 RepID=A0ABV2JIX9_9STRE
MTRITKIEVSNLKNSQKKIRVAAYARVSTNTEEQLLSLATQKEHYEREIMSHSSWEYAGLYYDEGISGTKIEKRDGLLKLLDDCENGRIDRVITKSISRFSRNTVDCLEMVRKLTGMGVYLYFEKENIDTEHMSSELMLSILSSIAESGSRSISENNKWSILRRFQNGTYIISSPPYGYENMNGKMVIVPHEAEVVREIFNMTISGMGSHKIANELNSRGIPTRKNSKWHSSTIRGILTNEKYVGDVIFQKTFTDDNFNRHYNHGEKGTYHMKNHHDPIIRREEFEMAKEVVEKRKLIANRTDENNKYQNRYVFTGKLKCYECGSNMKRCKRKAKSGDYIAWACINHIRDKKSCKMKQVREENIHAALIQMMNKLIAGKSSIVIPFIDGLRGTNDKNRLDRVLELEAKLEKLKEEANVLNQLFTSGYIEPEAFFSENKNLEYESDCLEKEKNELTSEINGDLTHLNEAKKLLKYLSKNKLIEQFQEELYLDFVDSIIVKERYQFIFQLKCGLKLQEEVKLK